MTRIILEFNAPPLYTISRPAENLLVIDLPGGEATQLLPRYAINSSTVDSIALRKSHVGSAANASATRYVGTNIEITLQGNVQDKSKLQGNTLIIELLAENASAAAPTASKPGVTVEPVPVSANSNVQPMPVKTTAEAKPSVAEKTAMTVAKTPAAEKVQPSANTLKAATVIRDVRSETLAGAARIIIETDGAAQFKSFALASPYRIVVDITGVRSQVGNKTVNVGVANVEKVRLGSPSNNVVRVVVDAKTQVPYRVEREGATVVITVGNLNAAKSDNTFADAPAATIAPVELPALDAKSDNAEVKVAGQRIDKEKETVSAPKPTPAPEVKASVKNDANKSATTTVKNVATNQPATTAKSAATNQPGVTVNPPAQKAKPAVAENTVAQVNQPTPNNPARNTRPRVSTSPNTSTNPGVMPPRREQITQTSTGGLTVAELQRQQPTGQGQPLVPTAPVTAAVQRSRADQGLCDPNYIGGLISFDLRAGVDLRDMLRFVYQQYRVNFIMDRSVGPIPVDISVSDLPWNYVLDSVLRANRLGVVCSKGIVRIASLDAIKEEEDKLRALQEAKALQVPLVTRIIHLRYARASGSLGGDASGASGGGGGGGGAAGGRGGVLVIAEKRLSPRGRIEMDPRTNSIIVTDLPEFVDAVEDIMIKLDKPEAQVEIEARIVIASRNFLRDLGLELAAGTATKGGKTAVLATSPVQFTPGGGVGGSGGGSGGGTSTGLAPNVLGPKPTGSLTAAANTVLGLTTGLIGTTIISATLTANESKGQVRTIASPRITTTDNKTAEIVNGVQIPVQTVSNNTITTTFVTAALRLQITPQIIEENGEVLMKVVAENNTVNTALASSSNNGTPGINTQSAESTVRVPDGGTTVMGGINIDTEGHSENRTPGVSRIPILGELFKRRTAQRNFDEILFFITPRIIRNDNVVKPKELQPLDGRVTPDTPPAKTTKKQ
ncbi:MAG: AMIN domain-containing protein [Acidobacteria bacterium]|nr:AMIN domain-containing protein [Acidobacteriota bacterium]